MISPTPFDRCKGCEYEGRAQHVMPCLACSFGSHYKCKCSYTPYSTYITTGRANGKAMYKDLLDSLLYSYEGRKRGNGMGRLEIKDVIFNDPATIVYWKDGTKTVVKTQGGEQFDPEKFLSMAICKKAYGNEGNYFNHIKKWVKKYTPKEIESLYPSMMFPRVKLNFSTEEKEEFKKMLNRIYGDPGLKKGDE